MSSRRVAQQRRITRAVTAALAVGAVLGASISVTEAQRSASQFASTSFSTVIEPALVLEGSVDGAQWNRSGTTTSLSFEPDQMALQVGEENAVFAPMQVRAGASTNVAAEGVVRETSLSPDSSFANSLRGEIFAGTSTCSATGVSGGSLITSDIILRGQESSTFDIAAPDPIGETGEATQLCVKIWMNDNNWLLGGTTPPTETATWTVTGTSR